MQDPVYPFRYGHIAGAQTNRSLFLPMWRRKIDSPLGTHVHVLPCLSFVTYTSLWNKLGGTS